ncbi:hypothetical protein [Pantanalinema sp. GBBB05]|uniref:hypothetical protein n=1 Tax=Pantanalinema sp. GBBB05 TaxID=2604139 RepID=UPI003D812E0C
MGNVTLYRSHPTSTSKSATVADLNRLPHANMLNPIAAPNLRSYTNVNRDRVLR